MNIKHVIVRAGLVLTLPMAGCMGAAGTDSDPELGSTWQALEDYESCLEGIDSDTTRGPFSYDTDTVGRVKLWVPDVPRGCRVPVVHFANGTGTRCSTYGSLVRSLASHGFLTACYEDTNTGAGTQGLEALQVARSRYASMVSDKIGSIGHSQGGQASFVVLALAEDEWGPSFTYAGLAMQPASGFGDQPRGGWRAAYGDVDSPMFMFSGSADFLVSASWVQWGFNALDRSVEAYNWRARGAAHIPVPSDEAAEIGIPWFRWKLLGDESACREFYDLRSSFGWSVSDEQNAKTCGR